MTDHSGVDNLMFARELFATWKACGLGCVVLAPGARCAALTLAARETGLNVVRIDDERARPSLRWDGHGLKVVPRPW